MAGVLDWGWFGDIAESRDSIMTCLRLAEIEADIIEDIADLCEVIGYTIAALAADDVCVETVADKLFLTEQEAITLIKVCRAEMRKAGLHGRNGSPPMQEPQTKSWDILGDSVQGFHGVQAGKVKPAGKMAAGGLAASLKGKMLTGQFGLQTVDSAAGRTFPTSGFTDSGTGGLDSSSPLEQLGKPRVQELSNGFKSLSLKASNEDADDGKRGPTSPYLTHSMSLGSWKNEHSASGAAAAGQLRANDRYPMDGGAGFHMKDKDRSHRDGFKFLKFRAFKPGVQDDGEDISEDESKKVYAFKSRGKPPGGHVFSRSAVPTPQAGNVGCPSYWDTSSVASNTFTSPYGGLLGEHKPARSPTTPQSFTDSSAAGAESESQAQREKSASLGMSFKFTQGASFDSTESYGQPVSRHDSLPASRPAPPRVPRLNLPQTGVPVKPELSRYSASYVPSSDESVDTIITESSARSTTSCKSVEQPRRGATVNTYSRPVKEPSYPWGNGGVEPYRPGATWTEGQKQLNAGKDSRYTLRRSGSNDSRRSDQSRKSFHWGTTASEGAPSLGRRSSCSSQGSTVSSTLPRERRKASFMMPTKSSKARQESKGRSKSSEDLRSKSEAKDGYRHRARSRSCGSRSLKTQPHRRTASAASQLTVPKGPTLSTIHRYQQTVEECKQGGGERVRYRAARVSRTISCPVGY